MLRAQLAIILLSKIDIDFAIFMLFDAFSLRLPRQTLEFVRFWIQLLKSLMNSGTTCERVCVQNQMMLLRNLIDNGSVCTADQVISTCSIGDRRFN